MIATIALIALFVCGGIAFLGVIGGPLDGSRDGWIWVDGAPPPPIAQKSIFDDPGEPL